MLEFVARATVLLSVALVLAWLARRRPATRNNAGDLTLTRHPWPDHYAVRQ